MNRPRQGRTARLAVPLLALFVLGGCASADRAAFELNLALGKRVLKPMGESYRRTVPKPIRSALRNVTDNIGYTETFANDLLQFKFARAHTDLQRLMVNTVVGFGGVFDAATDIGIPRYEEDFGQTLGVWGVPEGRYFNLPFFGPTTMRDVWRYPAAIATSPFTYFNAGAATVPQSVGSYLLRRFDEVEHLDFVEDAADPYAFVRDAYLQRRRAAIRDGALGAAPDDQAIDEAIDDALDDALEDVLDDGLDDALDDALDEGLPDGAEAKPKRPQEADGELNDKG